MNSISSIFLYFAILPTLIICFQNCGTVTAGQDSPEPQVLFAQAGLREPTEVEVILPEPDEMVVMGRDDLVVDLAMSTLPETIQPGQSYPTTLCFDEWPGNIGRVTLILKNKLGFEVTRSRRDGPQLNLATQCMEGYQLEMPSDAGEGTYLLALEIWDTIKLRRADLEIYQMD